MTRASTQRVLGFVLLVLVCGGGCMTVPYVPQEKFAIEQIGLDQPTKDRLEGLADPKPGDPEPTPGLRGRLMLFYVTSARSHDWHGRHAWDGRVTDAGPSEQDLTRLEALRGIESVSTSAFIWPEPKWDEHDQLITTEVNVLQSMLADAEKTNADLLLVYTAEHSAKSIDLTLGLGQILLLGFCPTVIARGVSGIDAVLMDAKTGYIYAFTMGKGGGGAVGIGWETQRTKADAATSAMRDAMSEIVDNLEAAWPDLQAAYD